MTVSLSTLSAHAEASPETAASLQFKPAAGVSGAPVTGQPSAIQIQGTCKESRTPDIIDDVLKTICWL